MKYISIYWSEYNDERVNMFKTSEQLFEHIKYLKDNWSDDWIADHYSFFELGEKIKLA